MSTDVHLQTVWNRCKATHNPANIHFNFFVWPLSAISLWDEVHMILGALYGIEPKHSLQHSLSNKQKNNLQNNADKKYLQMQ